MANASNSGPLALPTDVIPFVDERLARDLCGDDGSRLTHVQLLTNTNFLKLILAASGQLEARALRGGRYTAAQLAGLVGATRAWMHEIIGAMVTIKLLRRRDPTKELPRQYEEVENILKRLELGEEIFGIQEAVDAGEGMETIRLSDQQAGPRPAMTELAQRFFGKRARTYPASTQ